MVHYEFIVTWLSLILVCKEGVLFNCEMYQVSWNITSFLGNKNKKFLFLVTDVTPCMINFIRIFLWDKSINPIFFQCDLIKCNYSKLNHNRENCDQTYSWKICQNNVCINMPFWTLFCIHTLAAILKSKMAATVEKNFRSRNFRSWTIKNHEAFDLNINLIFWPLCPFVVKMPI